jgi:nucleoid DNA-binding protein
MNPEEVTPEVPEKKDFRETKQIVLSDFCEIIRDNLLKKGIDFNTTKISCVVNAYFEAMFDWMKENNKKKFVIKNFGSFRFSRHKPTFIKTPLHGEPKVVDGNKRKFIFVFSRAIGDILKEEIDIDKVRAYFTKKYKRTFEPTNKSYERLKK